MKYRQRGAHAYRGLLNSRSKRQRSKLYKGLKINFKKLEKAFKQLDENRSKQIQTNDRKRYDRMARGKQRNDRIL